MSRIRSLLWIGEADGMRGEGVADSPWIDVAWARDVEDASALPLASFDAVALQARDAEEARRDLLRLERNAHEDLPPIWVQLEVGGDDDDERTLRAAGAAGLTHPGGRDGVPDLLARLRRNVPPARSAPRERRSADFVAQSAAMRSVLQLVERATPSRATVLISGETGTGKELIARAIHRNSPRSKGRFVAVNCAAFPDTLLESELFGHVKGAFTGADRAKPGLFEVAGGGTLFLDEVGETAAGFQAKLLRALQEREIRPVGGERPRAVDVRVLAATNRELRSEVRKGGFREDLYYRLAVFQIRVPPLRERAEDVVPLALHFLRNHGEREGVPGCTLSDGAADLLRAYGWPGNVRELENEMQRALALVDAGKPVEPEHLSDRVAGALEPVEEATHSGETLRQNLDRLEAWLIRRSLEDHGGRRAATARTLGITREGLYKKMKRLGID